MCINDTGSYLHTYIHLTDFLKTNLTQFTVICVKRRQRAGFFSPISSKIIVTKVKTGEKEGARRRKGGEEKKTMVALLVFIMATLRVFLAERNCSTQKVHLVATLSKIQLDIHRWFICYSEKFLRVSKITHFLIRNMGRFIKIYGLHSCRQRSKFTLKSMVVPYTLSRLGKGVPGYCCPCLKDSLLVVLVFGLSSISFK